MEEAVTSRHAPPNTVFHCLYGFYCLGYSRKDLARIYHKSAKTIGNWIHVYERTGTYQRDEASSTRAFTKAHRTWLCEFFTKQPLAYLDEAQEAFLEAHQTSISKTSVWRILHDCGFTRKVLERRAMHIKEKDVFRFVEELSSIDWGQKIAIRGDFQRKPRVSVLAFMGINGIIDYYDTDGTFDRVNFFKSCRDFAYSTRGNVRQYPGTNSVWILDGASIHRDPEIIHFLRSIGRSFQRHYVESTNRNRFTIETFTRFEKFDMSNVFQHCGWAVQGHFDPTGPLSRENQQDARQEGLEVQGIDSNHLDFLTRQTHEFES
eukprot:jgi/Phyca11/108987/e_gw1.16.119.1